MEWLAVAHTRRRNNRVSICRWMQELCSQCQNINVAINDSNWGHIPTHLAVISFTATHTHNARMQRPAHTPHWAHSKLNSGTQRCNASERDRTEWHNLSKYFSPNAIVVLRRQTNCFNYNYTHLARGWHSWYSHCRSTKNTHTHKHMTHDTLIHFRPFSKKLKSIITNRNTHLIAYGLCLVFFPSSIMLCHSVSLLYFWSVRVLYLTCGIRSVRCAVNFNTQSNNPCATYPNERLCVSVWVAECRWARQRRKMTW